MRGRAHALTLCFSPPFSLPCAAAAMHTASSVRDLVRPLLLPDLRIQCRARGLNPGGGRDTLADRLAAHMLETGDW